MTLAEVQLEADRKRLAGAPALLRRKWERMAASPFAFLRGASALWAEALRQGLNFNEPDVPIELRRERSIDPASVADIVTYLISNQESYTIAPLIATVDDAVKFEPLNNEIPEIGQIRIPINARMIIHDGQHRREAIQQLLTKGAPIGDDTIPIMLIPDPKLDRSANLYSHFNRYQIQLSLQGMCFCNF